MKGFKCQRKRRIHFGPGMIAATAGLFLALASCGGDRLARKGEVTGHPVPLVQKEASWRGGLLGGALGAPFTGTFITAAAKAAEEAARENKPTAYVSTEGYQRVEAYPKTDKSSEGCRGVRVLFYQEGLKVGEETKSVCPP
jgi:hypothetical protein